MSIALMTDYQRTTARLKKAEAELAAALDNLAAARDAGVAGDITPAYKRAQQAERDCAQAWEAAEQARRAYWQQQARIAEGELEGTALPLLAAIEYCHRAGGATVSSPATMFLSRLGCLPRPPFAAGSDAPPIVPEDSATLERAEDSNIVLLRGGLTK